MNKIFLKKQIYNLIFKYNLLNLKNINFIDNNFLSKKINYFLKFYIFYIEQNSINSLYNNKNNNLYTYVNCIYNYKLHTNIHNNNNNNNFLSYLYNNLHYEIYTLSKINTLQINTLINTPRISKKRSNKSYEKITFWSNFYSFLPFQSLINSNLTIINFNILNSTTKQIHNLLLKDALQVFPFLKLNRVAAHFTATIYTALMLKDSKALTTFIRILLREVHFKQHPFYFSFVGSLIRDVIQPQLHFFNCLGVSVVFRGKLGIGGNARKRAIKYQTGMVSSSSKYVKLSRSLDVIRTKTGIVGFTVIVAW